MKLTLLTLGGPSPLIRPAPAERAWMDATPERFAYRCLPLAIANAHGWELLCRSACTVVWDGGPEREALRVMGQGDDLPISHFGSGILTFHIPALLRTEPGFDLWVGGPVNRPKPGAAPLTGIVETAWAPYTFTMNWQLTEPGRQVRFAAGEPFCTLFPIAQGLIESCEPEIRSIDSEPALAAAYARWAASRRAFGQELARPGSTAQAERWQKHYFRGILPDGRAADAHRTRLRPRPFPGIPEPWPAEPTSVGAPPPLLVERLIEPASLPALRRLLIDQAPSVRPRPAASADAVRLLQQARLIGARAAAARFGVPGPLYDRGLQVVRWTASPPARPEAAGVTHRLALVVVVEGGDAATVRSKDWEARVAPGALLAWPVAETAPFGWPAADGTILAVTAALTPELRLAARDGLKVW